MLCEFRVIVRQIWFRFLSFLVPQAHAYVAVCWHHCARNIRHRRYRRLFYVRYGTGASTYSEMYKTFWFWNLKGRYHLEDLGVNERISEWILTKIGWEGVDWMHLAQNSDQWEALVNREWNFGFHTRRRISWLAEWPLVFFGTVIHEVWII
jgi:hypothetical protein